MPIELKAIEDTIALALDDLLAPLDVRVYRFPETPIDFGEAGRISQLFVGFEKLRTTDRSEANPLTNSKSKVQRTYELTFKVNVELFDLTDYDDALDILDKLLTLDGYAIAVAGSRPLVTGELEFDSFENGYWRYEGELTLVIDTSIDIFRPDEYIKTVRADSVRVGIWKSPINKGEPEPDDSTQDQDYVVVPASTGGDTQ